MKKLSNRQKGLMSLSDIVLKILQERPAYELNETQFDDRKKYLVKKIHEKIGELGLSDFIKSYENHKRESYNKEWIDFFRTFLNYYTFKEDKESRKDILHNNHTIITSLIEYKKILSIDLLFAISKGKEPEKYFEMIKKTKFYKYATIFSTELIIANNINSFFSAINKYPLRDKILEQLDKIRKALNDVVYIKNDFEVNASLNLSFNFQASDFIKPSIIKNKLTENDVVTQITSALLMQNIYSYLISYFDMLNQEYESNQNENIKEKLFELNRTISGIIENSGFGGFYIIKEVCPLELKDIEELHNKKESIKRETPSLLL